MRAHASLLEGMPAGHQVLSTEEYERRLEAGAFRALGPEECRTARRNEGSGIPSYVWPQAGGDFRAGSEAPGFSD